jgi:hypothetical protein
MASKVRFWTARACLRVRDATCSLALTRAIRTANTQQRPVRRSAVLLAACAVLLAPLGATALTRLLASGGAKPHVVGCQTPVAAVDACLAQHGLPLEQCAELAAFAMGGLTDDSDGDSDINATHCAYGALAAVTPNYAPDTAFLLSLGFLRGLRCSSAQTRPRATWHPRLGWPRTTWWCAAAGGGRCARSPLMHESRQTGQAGQLTAGQRLIECLQRVGYESATVPVCHIF